MTRSRKQTYANFSFAIAKNPHDDFHVIFHIRWSFFSKFPRLGLSQATKKVGRTEKKGSNLTGRRFSVEPRKKKHIDFSIIQVA